MPLFSLVSCFDSDEAPQPNDQSDNSTNTTDPSTTDCNVTLLDIGLNFYEFSYENGHVSKLSFSERGDDEIENEGNLVFNRDEQNMISTITYTDERGDETISVISYDENTSTFSFNGLEENIHTYTFDGSFDIQNLKTISIDGPVREHLVTFTWSNGNITKVVETGSDGQVYSYTHIYTYDDKPSVFRKAMNGIFIPFLENDFYLYSENNINTLTSSKDNYKEKYTYNYLEDGRISTTDATYSGGNQYSGTYGGSESGESKYSCD